jgi:CO/xanthine dehydrogenase FAD-binding subunit
MALPAGPMAALCTALEGVCTIWTPNGGSRSLPVAEFIVGPNQNALQPGELLRAIELPVAALRHRTAFRQISLTPLGRSAALLIGTLTEAGAFALIVTAATRRPFRIVFATSPDGAELRQGLETTIPDAMYYDDLHGDPDWRRCMTFRLAEEIRQELLRS